MSIRDDLKAFVDNELPEERAEEVRLAIEQDPALQQEVTFMKLLSREIQESAAEPEIKGAAEVIDVVRKKPGIFKRYRTAWSIGAIALIMLLALPYLNPESKVAMNDSTTTSTPASSELAAVAKAPLPQHLRMGSTKTRAFKNSVSQSVGNAAPAEPKAFDGHDLQEDASGGVAGHPLPDTTAGSAVDATRTTTTGAQPNDVAQDPANPVPAPAPSSPPQISPRAQFPQVTGNRKIIQNGDLAVTVEDVQSAQNKATYLAAINGGFVESNSLDYDAQSQPEVKLTLRIPVQRFSAVAAAIQGFGKVTSDHVTGQDVTAQYADVNARLQELAAEEDSYVTMLRGAKSIGQILEIKDRISQVRQEIQSDHAVAEALKDQSALSTLNVTFDQKARVAPKPAPKEEPKDPWAKDSFKSALSGLTTVGRFLAQVIIFLFVYSPIWIPIAGLIWWLNKRKK